MPASEDTQSGDCLHAGQWGQVKFARASASDEKALLGKAEWDAQSNNFRSRFLPVLIAITCERDLRLANFRKFKQVEGDLFEFKHNGLKARIFAFRDLNCWYVVDVFVGKKEDDLPTGVVKRARGRMESAKAVLAEIAKAKAKAAAAKRGTK